jgi:DNA-binding CsgD family transcriptional regulator
MPIGRSPTHDEHMQVLDCIQELHRCRSLVAFPQHALQALALLIPSNLSAFNEVNLARGRMVSITDHPIPDLDQLIVNWERHRDQHPLVRYVLETGDGQAVKFSDFLSEAEYHRLELYRSFYRVIQAEDQICITVRSDEGVLIAIAFNRARRGFTESDRVKLNLVRPHVLQAYANAEELAGHREEKDDLQTALRETGHGLIALDARGQVAHATPGAPECLTRFFPDATALDVVPRAIADWLDGDFTTPFTLHDSAAKLIVRSPRDTERRLLLLSEERCRPLPSSPRLTPREREVLRWLAEGKSNGAIATILGVASGTVKQHVEHILAKLGVENRTAAAAYARTHGL